MSDSPCHGCTERYTACHDHCKKYKKWRAKLDAANAARRLENEVIGSVNRHIHDCNVKTINKK